MRARTAVAVSLLFALDAFAEVPSYSGAEWISVYQSALAANQRHDDETARILLEKCWQTEENDEERGLAADGLGETMRRLGRAKDAQEWFERAAEDFRKDPKQALHLAVAVGNLADMKRSGGDYQGAEVVLRGELSSDICDVQTRGFLRNRLADLLREQGRTAEAQTLFRQTLDSRDLTPRERISSLVGLADIDRQQSAWQTSISQWSEALELSRHEKDEAAEAIVLRGLGITWLEAGSPARAEPLLRRSLKLMEANAGVPSEEVACSHAGLAQLYRAENKLALAEDEWRRALEIDRRVLGEAHPQVAILMEMLSDVYAARGEFAMARDYATRALHAMSGAFGDGSMAAAAALVSQATVEQRAGELTAATGDFERALAIARAHPGYRSVGITIMERYAGLLKTMHRGGEARTVLAQRNALR
jgi:tetratricopeptide (TPR) repeat protein